MKPSKPIKVVHFVTGGFSGATYVVMDIIRQHQKQQSQSQCQNQHHKSRIESVLVLRQKKNTTEKLPLLTPCLSKLDDSNGCETDDINISKIDTNKTDTDKTDNIHYHVITGKSHFASIRALQVFCQSWQPDILVAHGFPEHLIGRWAGIRAHVPHLVQVEHASKERYSKWRFWQSRFLSKHTDYAVAISDAVADVLTKQRLDAPVMTLKNGINIKKYHNPSAIKSDSNIADKPNDIIMVARFSSGKDHATLIHAIANLKKQGIKVGLNLAGSGSKKHKNKAKKLIKKYQLTDQVTFLGHVDDIHTTLASHKVFVLSSYHEGLSLSVMEAMAAGCIVIGTDVAGIAELIAHEQDGFLFQPEDTQVLTNILKQIITHPNDYDALVKRAQNKVLTQFSAERMANDYLSLFERLVTFD